MASILSNLLSGKQYTIGELMNVDAGRQTKAQQCKVTFERAYHELKREGILGKFKALFSKNYINVYYLILKFSVVSENGSKYNVFVRLNPDFSTGNWQNNKVKIYCGCADFKYRSAYLLDQRNSLFRTTKLTATLGKSVSEAPTGKRGTTLLCKHSYAVLSWLMKNYKSVMSSI